MEKVRRKQLIDHPANHNWLEESDEEELFGPRGGGAPKHSNDYETSQHSLYHSVVASRPTSQASSMASGKRPMTYSPAKNQKQPSNSEFRSYLPKREFPLGVHAQESPRIPSFDFRNEPTTLPDLEIPRLSTQSGLRSPAATDLGQDLELQEKATFRVSTRVMNTGTPGGSNKSSKRTSRVATNLRGPPTRFGAADPRGRDSRSASRTGSRMGSPSGSRGSSPGPGRALWTNKPHSMSAENLHLNVSPDNLRSSSESGRRNPPISPIASSFHRAPSALSQSVTNTDLKRQSLRGSKSTSFLRQEVERMQSFAPELEGGSIVPIEYNPHGGASSSKGSTRSRPSTPDFGKPQIPVLKFSGARDSGDTESFMYQKYADQEQERPDSAFDLPRELP